MLNISPVIMTGCCGMDENVLICKRHSSEIPYLQLTFKYFRFNKRDNTNSPDVNNQ